MRSNTAIAAFLLVGLLGAACASGRDRRGEPAGSASQTVTTAPGYLGPPTLVPSDSQTLSPAAQAPPEAPAAPESSISLANSLINDKVGDVNEPQSEATIAVDPGDPRRLVAGFNDCRGFGVPSRNGITGWGFSTDNGATWNPSQAGLPKAAPGDFGTRGDPSIDVDSAGNFYFASLYAKSAVGALMVSVHKGRFAPDGTFVWNAPTFAAPFASGAGADKEHVGVDKRPGSQNVYVSYTNFSATGNGQVEIVASSDGGATWSPPVVIAAGSATGHQGSIPRVGPDGEIYVAWEDGFAQGGASSLHVRKSTAWPAFGPDVTVASVTSTANPSFNSRINDFPTMAVDNTVGPNRGRVYVAWNDGRFGGVVRTGAILLAHSSDGASWSEPVMLNDDGLPSSTGIAHWFPWITVDPRGVAMIGWYDRRLAPSPGDGGIGGAFGDGSALGDDGGTIDFAPGAAGDLAEAGQGGAAPEAAVGDISLTDVFATEFRVSSGPKANVRLTSQSFSMLVPSLCTPNFGDYNGAAASATDFHFAYGDGRNGNPDAFHSGVQTSPMSVETSAEACAGQGAPTATVDLFGGPGQFEGDVTLSLIDVSPAPPSGGEITATFVPNPVPTPAPGGSKSVVQIATTSATPAGTYTLTIQGASATLTTTTMATLVVRSQPPSAPTLLSPADGADSVLPRPTFTWSPASEATSYVLDVLASNDCSGVPVRSYSTRATAFVVPEKDALDLFQTLSWRVTAVNSCAPASVSGCFTFRTESCAAPQDFVGNGGFEQGLTGWTSDAVFPRPQVTAERPHGGANAVRLGTIRTASGTADGGTGDGGTADGGTADGGPPVPFGDSTISQVLKLPAGASSTLTFWYWPQSSSPISLDQQYVRVTPLAPAGPTVELMRETNNAQTYLQRAFSLAAFAGQTVRLTFGVHEGGFASLATGMFVDDVSVVSRHCGPPDFAVVVTPPAFDEVCNGGALDFAVSIQSVNGPNFTSPVTLAATNLASGTSVQFAANPIAPGTTTTMTLQTTRPTVGRRYAFDVSGVAVNPPPAEARTVTTSVLIDANPPDAPQIVSPRDGDVNVPRRPTLSWTAPLVRNAPTTTADDPANPAFFGASQYHVQLARDAAFGNLVLEADASDASFTVPIDLDIATEYFWRVSATNACGTGQYSKPGAFIVGACFQDWSQLAPLPAPGGIVQSTVVASATSGKIYVIGGATSLFGAPVDQVWAYDPTTDAWARKSDVPAPGVGANFGAAAEVGGVIYVFGGRRPLGSEATLWRYDIQADSWSRGADLPTADFGSAVAAIGGKIYIAYGSGFGAQTWQYDPATDTYARKADALPVSSVIEVAGVALGGELHAISGSLFGASHTIYDPVTDTWRVGPSLPFAVTDPAAGVIGGKAYVIGGHPVARTQIFDPVTNAWAQGTPLTAAASGLDSAAGAFLGFRFHLIGGSSGTTAVNTHWQLHLCEAGSLSSSVSLPLAIDGDGQVAGIGNERTSLLINNAFSGSTLTTTCFFYGTDGTILGRKTFSAAPNELKTVTDVVRAVTGTSSIQNVTGSLALFGTDVFEGTASLINATTGDTALEDGQPLTGLRNGFVPTVQSQTHVTQAVFANLASRPAFLELIAYPPEGGDVAAAATLALVPPHGALNSPDVVSTLGLPSGFLGQLTWSSDRPMAVVARDLTFDLGFSGMEPTRTVADAASVIQVPYVEDSLSFSTRLEINNPGAVPANVTVSLTDVADPTGTSPGTVSTRDVTVQVNSATSIPDVARWVLGDTGAVPSGKRGFLAVTTPQAVTAQAKILDNASLDPSVPQGDAALMTGDSPLLVQIEPLSFAPASAASLPSTTASRFAVSNPGVTAAMVQIVAFNASGSLADAQPFFVNVAPNGQYFTENLAADMGLPPIFFGSVSIQSSAPVLVYNHRRSGEGGSTVPVHAR